MRPVPSIDVHSPAGLLSPRGEQELAAELAKAALRAEGLDPSGFLLGMSWVFFHRYQPSDVLTGAGTTAENAVRVLILAPYGRLGPAARQGLIQEVSDAVARVVGDPAQRERTFVLVSETAENGWGLAGLTGRPLAEWARQQAGPAPQSDR
jgi:phenylpyruvate tautomerase PptA (4-oxalocrotonate tautomerase family)